MQPIGKIVILLCTWLIGSQLHAQENSVSDSTSCVPVTSVREDSLVFQGGERMQFVMHYKWGAINSDVGHATVSLDTLVIDGQDAFCCKVYGYTTRLFDIFFKVREDFRSWFTRDGLRPLKFTRDTQEGGYRAQNTYIYNWDAPVPYIDADVYSTSSGQRNLEIPLTPCTFDLPALFFFARNMDFDKVAPDMKYPMTFAIDDDVYNVYFILRGRETIKVKGLGTVKTIKFAAKLLEGGVFKGDEDMSIWISDDMNRLPVYFEAPILVGTASGRMVGYEGLKYPFEALVTK